MQSIGLVAAVYLMLYTGLLFRDIGAGTITGSPLLPFLFLVSALSTGVALLLVPLVFGRIGVHFHRLYARLLRIDTIFIVLEAALLTTLFLLASFEPRQAEQVAILLQGDYANMFWIGVVFCGLSAPAILENLSGKIIGLQMRAIPVSVMVLVGGYCLRASIIGVGVWTT
ncbi:MAG: polysulfide reductase NrfD [Actinobacteria bacterium]|nr:polysulfide reductase NrfD [Actinomycetota bacterium]